MPREKAQAATTARLKVPMRRLGADCFVVVMKRGNARGAKGAGHRHLDRVNRQREEPDVQWKAAAFARWHEPDDARVSSPDLRGARGEIPWAYSANPVFRVFPLHVRLGAASGIPSGTAPRRSRAIDRD